MNRKSKGQVLPFTLSEVFTLLFFALALVLVYEAFRLKRVQDEARENQLAAEAIHPLGLEDARTLIEMVTEARDSIPEDFQELVSTMRRESEERKQLENRLVELMRDSVWVDTASVRELLDSLEFKTVERRRIEQEIKRIVENPVWVDSASGSELLDSLISSHEKSKVLAEQLTHALDLGEEERHLVDKMAADISRAERESSNLRGQLRYQIAKAGNGLDHPPCWTDAAGSPEYAYEVRIMTETVSVRPIWPPRRDNDADTIPGMLALQGGDLTYGEFISRAIPVFNWSTRQDPECRHLVVLFDRVDGGKEAFKEALLTVERFFYKSLRN